MTRRARLAEPQTVTAAGTSDSSLVSPYFVGGDAESSAGALLAVTIVTPYGTRAEYNVRHLRAPGAEGEFGVLAGHIPFLTALRAGALILDSEQGRKIWALSGGFAEVLGDRVTVLAETAERAETIDVARAEAARQRALGRLKPGALVDVDISRAKAAMTRALNRLQVASSARGNQT